MNRTCIKGWAILTAMTALAACNTPEAAQRCNTRICDYLYEVEYDDYDFQAGVRLIADQYYPHAACSEVRKGNFVGRNLDWYINCDADFVVRVKHAEGRYASIGMSGCFPLFTDSLASTGEPTELYNMLPLMTTDGINEKGLYVGVNVMPTGETSLDSKRWQTGAWGLGAAFTNPEAKQTYCVSYLVRYLLDNASSVAEAKEKVEAVNWYEPMDFPHKGESQAFHWFIADSVSNAVLEFLDNKAYFIETTEVREPSYATIMTNFTNKLMADGQQLQPSGCGYERWDILHDNYASTEETSEGMESLMQKVWYTKAYTAELDEDFPFTEFACADFPATEMYHNPSYKDNKAYAEFIARQKALFADKANWHVPSSPLWYTTHSVVYDLKNRKLRVMTHEGLDGQEDYYEASLLKARSGNDAEKMTSQK